jgi:hypothetical protein
LVDVEVEAELEVYHGSNHCDDPSSVEVVSVKEMETGKKIELDEKIIEEIREDYFNDNQHLCEEPSESEKIRDRQGEPRDYRPRY